MFNLEISIMWNKKISIGISVLFLAVFVVESASAKQELLLYQNQQYKFHLKYPIDWERQPITGKILFKIKSPRQFASNCSVAVRYHEKLTGKTNKEVMNQLPENYYARKLATRFNGARVVTAKRTRLDKLHAIKHVIDIPYRQDARTLNITLSQMMAFYSGRMYIISCASPTSQYRKMKRIFRRIEKSFRFDAR